MKTLLLIAMLLPAFAFTQVTTKSEYDFMKNGYRDVEEKGADLKRGYTVEDISTMKSYNGNNVLFKVMKRSDKTIAGVIVKTQVIGSDYIKYYAIPAVNTRSQTSYGWEEFFEDVNNMEGGLSKAMLKYITYRWSYDMHMHNKYDPMNSMITDSTSNK